MSGEDVYADLDLQLHHSFTGREDLLGELGGQLVENATDRCVALIGSSGTGKSAAATSWVAHCKASRELVFGHFIRAQCGDRAEPLVIAGSLARQIETQFPHLRNPYARPEARLAQLLARVSAQELIPHGRRLVLVIDGLDERTPAGDVRKVLSWLPRPPSGIRLLLAGRLRDRLRDLEALCHPLALVDLDDPSFAADNEATVAAYWDREAAALGLDSAFAAHAARRSGGNMLHAALLRKHVGSVARLDGLDAIPADVRSLLTRLWERVRDDRPVVRALDILCVAREPLSLEQIGRVARLSDATDLLSFGRVAGELLAELRGSRGALYALFHESVRGFLVERLGPTVLRALNRELADQLATWPLPRDPLTRRYALRHAISHRIAAGDHDAIRALVGNIDLLELKCRELGIDDVELDLRRAAEAAAAAGQMSLHGEIDRLLRLLASESRVVSRDTGVDASPLWDRVRRDRRPAPPLAPPLAPPPRTDHAAQGTGVPAARQALQPAASVGSAAIGPFTAKPQAAAPSIVRRGSPTAALYLGRPPLLGLLGTRGAAVTACAISPESARVIAAYSDLSIHIYEIDSGHRLKKLIGHAATIQACVVSPDGRWLVSASADHTLKVWELESGDELATFVGHTGPVMSCSVTPDGSHVVSASADRTVRVWDVGAASCTATLQGHTGAVQDCAVSPDGSWAVSASTDTTLKVWDLERLCLVDTFTGHIDAVESCAVAPDGRYVVSGSSDHTLKVWNVGNGSVTTLKGHGGAVTSCVVAANSRSVCSASADATIRIWDVDTGHTITTLDEHTRPVTCCAIAPNGRRLVSGSSDGALRVWALDGNRTSTLRGGAPVTVVSTSKTLLKPRPAPATARPRILFLAAKGANQSTHTKEYAAIERELQMAPHGNDFDLRSKWALTSDDIARYLLELDPTIIHLRGARMESTGGEPDTGPGMGPVGDSGIWLRDERGGMRFVTGRALKMMVTTTAPSARLVVLNACYSDDHATQLCQVVECVVGMVRDHAHAALSFAVAFYRMIGHGKSVGEALAHAVAMLAVEGVPDECVPRCRTRDWADAHEISFLAEPGSVCPDR